MYVKLQDIKNEFISSKKMTNRTEQVVYGEIDTHIVSTIYLQCNDYIIMHERQTEITSDASAPGEELDTYHLSINLASSSYSYTFEGNAKDFIRGIMPPHRIIW